MRFEASIAVGLLIAGCSESPTPDVEPGSRREGEPCGQNGDCVVGNLCHNGICRLVCNSNRECDALTQHCEMGFCLPGSRIECGNNVVEPGEGCDDGAQAPGDGCSAACLQEGGWACVGDPSVCTVLCSNGVVDVGESCDDGDALGGDGCSSSCQTEPGYACSGTPSVCTTMAVCGNGTPEIPEGCDDGDLDVSDGCPDGPGGTCQPATCGDGHIWSTDGGSEVCDDGGTSDGDGCSNGCISEPNYTCTGQPSTCACETNFQDNDNDGTCEPACSGWPDPSCGGNGLCDDSAGPAACNCNMGFQDNNGDGVCEADCSNLSCVNGTCDDANGPAVCVCTPNWTGALCDRCVVYVDSTNSATQDGLSWATAYPTIQEGIDHAAMAATACNVWVRGGCGTCAPGQGMYHIYQSSAADTLTLAADVELYGGFAGTETQVWERNTTAYASTINGESQAGGMLVNRVIHGATNAVLDTFVVVNSSGGVDGGGIHNAGTGFEVRGTFFINHAVSGRGGAIFNDAGAELTVLFSAFLTSAADRGGAIYADTGGTLITSGTTVKWNSATSSGGGIFVNGAAAYIGSTAFISNGAADEGGAIAVVGSPGVSIDSGTLFGSVLGGMAGRGGAVFSDGTPLTINNSRIEGSFVLNGEGGAVWAAGADVVIDRTLVAGNTAGDADAIWSEGGVLTIVNSAVVGHPSSSASVVVKQSAILALSTIIKANPGPSIRVDDAPLVVTGSVLMNAAGSVTLEPVAAATAMVDYSFVTGLSDLCTGAWCTVGAPSMVLGSPGFAGAPAGGTGFTAMVHDPMQNVTTLVDPAQNWVPGALNLALLWFSDGRAFLVVANDATSLLVAGDATGYLPAVPFMGTYSFVSIFPAPGSPLIDAARDVMISADILSNPRWQATLTPPSGMAGAPSYPDIGAVEIPMP